MSFGAYPAIGLKDSRERRDEARKPMADGADPGAVRKVQKAAKQERAASNFRVGSGKVVREVGNGSHGQHGEIAKEKTGEAYHAVPGGLPHCRH